MNMVYYQLLCLLSYNIKSDIHFEFIPKYNGMIFFMFKEHKERIRKNDINIKHLIDIDD
jgi:hypothetical protein